MSVNDRRNPACPSGLRANPARLYFPTKSSSSLRCWSTEEALGKNRYDQAVWEREAVSQFVARRDFARFLRKYSFMVAALFPVLA